MENENGKLAAIKEELYAAASGFEFPKLTQMAAVVLICVGAIILLDYIFPPKLNTWTSLAVPVIQSIPLFMIHGSNEKSCIVLKYAKCSVFLFLLVLTFVYFMMEVKV
jgi:hypothetical protein